MIKLLCKIWFTPDNSNNKPIEIFGQIEMLQLNSQNCDWITVESRFYLNNKLHSKTSIIHKQEIIRIVIYNENKRYVIDKQSLALNMHVLSFIGVKT